MSAWRHYLVLVLFLGACSGVAARVVYLNVSDRAFLQEQGDARSIRHETLPAYRGVIYDRNGEALAVSTPVATIWTDPSFMRLSAEVIDAVAAILDLNPTTLAANLEANARREFMYLKRR
ncbi:MAG: penicillin-binding protein 2, partial [Pseudomonadales bacterium]